MPQLTQLLAEQEGVVCRRQLRELGIDDNDIRRLVRTRQLSAVHRGVYVNHTGRLTWHQRAWAGVLAVWPAALSHDSALRAAEGPGRRDHLDSEPIHVAVSDRRSLVAPEGVAVHRTIELPSRVQWNRSPPRLRVEEAVLDLAAEVDNDFDAVAFLADAVSSRRTTAKRLIAALEERKAIARRPFIMRVLGDVDQGTCSVLEHGYLTRVERPHGLPTALRQAVDLSRGTLYRDVLHVEFHQIVELDGRLWHTGSRRRDHDLARDLNAAADGHSSVRLGWGQVFNTPCDTAAKVGRILQAKGVDRCREALSQLPLVIRSQGP